MTRRFLGCSLHACILVSLVACGDRDDDMGDDGGGIIPPTTTGDGTDSGPEKFDLGGDGDGDGSSGDGTECPCSNVLDGIYVLNSNSPPSVWFFDPPANTFTEVGTLGCDPGVGWTANSMAIDRAGYAWVNYYDLLSETGKIFKAPLGDLGSCVQQPYQQPAGEWWLLGMGYAVTDPVTSCDELFVYKSDKYIDYPNFTPGGAELAEYTEGNGQLKILGNTPYPVGELTGTGDGRLFTFATVSQNQAVLSELDKDTGMVKQMTDLSGFDITNAFAFAFWGGDVYFFTETAPGSGVSKVTKLDYDENEGGGLSTYNANTGIHIPGAGVSTCASYTPPG
jgi:hypothetical protein